MACQTVVDGCVHTSSRSGEAFESVGPLVFPRASVEVVRYCDGGGTREHTEVVCECELSIAANGVELVRLLCSVAALRELAYGFLYSETVIRTLADVRGCRMDTRAMGISFDLAVPVGRPGCPTVSSGFGGRVLRSPLGPTGTGLRSACDADELRDHRAEAPGERSGGRREALVLRGCPPAGARRLPCHSRSTRFSLP